MCLKYIVLVKKIDILSYKYNVQYLNPKELKITDIELKLPKHEKKNN